MFKYWQRRAMQLFVFFAVAASPAMAEEPKVTVTVCPWPAANSTAAEFFPGALESVADWKFQSADGTQFQGDLDAPAWKKLNPGTYTVTPTVVGVPRGLPLLMAMGKKACRVEPSPVWARVVTAQSNPIRQEEPVTKVETTVRQLTPVAPRATSPASNTTTSGGQAAAMQQLIAENKELTKLLALANQRAAQPPSTILTPTTVPQNENEGERGAALAELRDDNMRLRSLLQGIEQAQAEALVGTNSWFSFTKFVKETRQISTDAARRAHLEASVRLEKARSALKNGDYKTICAGNLEIQKEAKQLIGTALCEKLNETEQVVVAVEQMNWLVLVFWLPLSGILVLAAWQNRRYRVMQTELLAAGIQLDRYQNTMSNLNGVVIPKEPPVRAQKTAF